MNVEGTTSIARHPTTTIARRIRTRLAVLTKKVIVKRTNPHSTETSVGRIGNFPPPCGAAFAAVENVSVSVLLAPLVPGITEAGENEPVAPAGRPVMESATELLYGPPDGGTVIVTAAGTFRLTMTGATISVIEKVAFTV